jgi:hypothetical protein
MSDWSTWLLIEYGALGLLGLAAQVQRMRERAALRRLALMMFTRPPMNTTPPTLTELRAPEWATEEASDAA